MALKQERFREVINNCEHKILNMCKKFSSKEKEQTDMYEKILTNIWKSIDLHQENIEFNIWIYRIAVNSIMGFASKSIYQQKIFLTNEGKYLCSFLNTNNINSEELITVEKELNRLSIIEKIITTLSFESLTSKDIALIIGITEPGVKKKLEKIRVELTKGIKL
ncbi:MAG: hypothetical protein MI739_01020 [Bacteroidales bacterium]|nr:hypothetical protein [Bacteroidales bacterium]